MAFDIPDNIRRVEAMADRVETPCGDGTLVWHVWGGRANGAVQGERPVVLLHGGSGSWTHWLRNIEPLIASGRRVLAPDLPGMGDSALPPGGMDADSLPEPVEAGLRQLLGNGPCDIVGFSFGSMVGGFIAERWPARVARLVIVGAPGMGMWAGRNTLELSPWRHIADAAARRDVHRHNLGVLMLHDAVSVDDDTARLQQYNAERDRTRGRSIARTDVLIKALRNVACPVFAIYGEHDALYRERLPEVRRLLEALPSFGQFVQVQGAGHWVQYENAPAFNRALLAALGAPAPAGFRRSR